MPRFRTTSPRSIPSTLEDLQRLAEVVLAPRHFYTGAGVSLEWQHVPAVETSWEVFRGRLLDPAHTRQSKTFETWDIYLVEDGGRSAEPLLSLKLDREGGQLHVVRGLLCYVWEGYDAGGNVYLSRETTRWVRELTATITLAEFAGIAELADELIGNLFHAVVGASRLPLTSTEAPLPAFALGKVAYFFRPAVEGRSQPVPMRSRAELLDGTRDAGLCLTEQAKLLEMLLHATPPEEMADLAGSLARDESAAEPLGLLRTLFNEVSLSPYTDLVDRALALVDELERGGHATAAATVDCLGGLIRQLGRHLTAYDLVTFHHRGANYPDALLLDAALKAYLRRIECHPALFDVEDGPEADRKRLRRRALRQGWLLRRFYEGHPVPDAPTSPGESARVLPPPHPRISEEQILHPTKRTRRLFADDSLDSHLGPHGEAVLRQSLRDLHHPAELRELGLALFLDRPLGIGKAPGEPDQTVLLSHLAFSHTIARQRLKFLAQRLQWLPEPVECAALLQAMAAGLRGVPVSALGGRPRPGAVAAADARQVADDFLFLRTTAPSVQAFFAQYDFAPLLDGLALHGLGSEKDLLILMLTGDRVVVHDAAMRPRLELRPDGSRGFRRRAGDGFPAAGLRVLRAWVADAERPGELCERNFLDAPLLVPPIGATEGERQGS